MALGQAGEIGYDEGFHYPRVEDREGSYCEVSPTGRVEAAVTAGRPGVCLRESAEGA